MSDSKTLEDKKAELHKLRIEVSDLEDSIRIKEQMPKMKKLVGTYSKYRNSYSCPAEESDYWWMYRKIVSLKSDGTLTAETFQTDKYGKVSIEFDKFLFWSGSQDSWMPIRRAEWSRELKKVQAKISKLGLKAK